jgi:DNA-binding GntR family transcriptional regulator
MLPSAPMPDTHKAALANGGRKMNTLQESAPTKTRRSQTNLMEVAYERLEQLIITCDLKPGSFLSIQDLQDITGSSRTPIYQAVNRLATDTLVVIHPRHGIRVAPIDLARERMLLRLRRDLERFVIMLVVERATSTHRTQVMHVARMLREHRETMTISEFNAFDSRIDRLILQAAGEPFLEHTLRPLHTIFRRIGWIHHMHIGGESSVLGSIDAHLAILDAVATRQTEQALEASDRLIVFVEEMFDQLERQIDPSILDCSIEPLLA